MTLFAKRTKGTQPQPAKIASDLDALVSEAIAFKIHGKVHTLNPVTVQEFLNFSYALTHAQSLQAQTVVSPEELIDVYFQVFASVCNTITKEDVKDMTQAQIAALFQLIVDSIMGKVQGESGEVFQAEKKKNL